MQFLFGIICVFLAAFTLTFQIWNSRRIKRIEDITDNLTLKLQTYEQEKQAKKERKAGNKAAPTP